MIMRTKKYAIQARGKNKIHLGQDGIFSKKAINTSFFGFYKLSGSGCGGWFSIAKV
jgi:hypothetical protein